MASLLTLLGRGASPARCARARHSLLRQALFSSGSTYIKDAQGTNTLETATPAGVFGGTCVATGDSGSPTYRVHFKNTFDKRVSPWHDIKLHSALYGTFNCIIEIPKFTTAKMEMQTKEEHNPIGPDMKDGKPRHYHGPIYWNYGFLPQTWEDPNKENAATGCKGDGDPLDVVEIGSAVLPLGSVVAVKPLGILAMIDQGELDWKIIAINLSDPLAQGMHDLEHLEAKHPEVLSGIREWFRWYKTPDGKPLNTFAFDGKVQSRAVANEMIAGYFDQWRELRFGNAKNSGEWVQKVASWTDGL